MELNWNVQRGRDLEKNPFCGGGMDIFDAILLMLLTCSFRDYLDFPSYPQSFDIAVSPDLRNSKSQGKGDRSRREKYVWCLAISHCKNEALTQSWLHSLCTCKLNSIKLSVIAI